MIQCVGLDFVHESRRHFVLLHPSQGLVLEAHPRRLGLEAGSDAWKHGARGVQWMDRSWIVTLGLWDECDPNALHGGLERRGGTAQARIK